MTYIRSAGLRGFRAVTAELGGDALDFARRAGLPEAALDSDDMLISDVAVATVLEVAASQLECPDFGLRVATRQDLTLLGSLALAIQHSATIGDAMVSMTRYLHVHAQSLSVTFGADPDGKRGGAGLYYRPATSSGPIQATDLALGMVHRAVTYLTGGDYGLYGVDLPYQPPAFGAIYQDFFGCPVRFARPHKAAILRVPGDLREHKISSVNDNLRRLALAFLAEQARALPRDGTPERDLTSMTRAILRESLWTSTTDIASVARNLDIHPRTLQRRLQDDGVMFTELVDDARRDAAHQLLTTTDLPLTQIARMVGFAEQSGLSRAARRWWGSAPSTVRANTETHTPPPR